MIALITACALLFAWAVIATAVAINHSMTVTLLQGYLRHAEERVGELEDASRATSLAELRQYRPTAAMEVQPPEERRFWTTDPTGLIQIEVDPRDVEQPGE
jgi:low affinity Fe/Cu permease